MSFTREDLEWIRDIVSGKYQLGHIHDNILNQIKSRAEAILSTQFEIIDTAGGQDE